MRRDVFQAIADPTRREILDLLSSRERNLNEVAAEFKISRPAISRHVRILSECGLLRIRKEGRERICVAKMGRLKEVADWSLRYEAFWNKKLDDLGTFLKQKK